MTDFMMQDSESERIPALLSREIPGFVDSREYQLLDSWERETPGLMCAALARYWLRLQREERAGSLASGATESLASIYRLVDTLASSEILEVQNHVVTEILENLDADEEILPLIRSRLGPHAKALYDRWLG